MDASTTVTWRCAKGLRDIDARAVRTASVPPARHAAEAVSDDADPVATLAEILVTDATMDVVYGLPDPDGYGVTGDAYYVEILTAPRPEWVGFARVSTAWTPVKPYVRRGTTEADLPEHRRARPAGFGVAGYRALPPVHRDPVAMATYERGLALLGRVAAR